MTTYFGFALADSMFPNHCSIVKTPIDPFSEKGTIEEAVNCCNRSHLATVEAAEKRFGLTLEIPEKPPRVTLKKGDSIIVMGVRGLPRLEDRRHYDHEEIERATFIFSRYDVS